MEALSTNSLFRPTKPVACMVALYKAEGDPQECGRNRVISLESVMGIINPKVLINQVVTGVY